MTSPALLVLCLALVCSIFGTALEPAADHGNQPTQPQPTTNTIIYDEIFNTDINMEHRTKLDKDTNKILNNHYMSVERNSYNIDNEEIFTKYQSNKNVFLDKYKMEINGNGMRQYNDIHNVKRREKRETDLATICEPFKEKNGKLTHPHDRDSDKLYSNATNCVTTLTANDGEVIRLTFVDVFHIEEGTDGSCRYDYLEIRDGAKGYAKLLKKMCGSTFPPQIISSGPALWLKFHSDETIEYEGFHINIEKVTVGGKNTIPKTCNKTMNGTRGCIKSTEIDKECEDYSEGKELEAIWTIVTPPHTKIYLNFSIYSLKKPNDCEENVVQVYGYILEDEFKLAHYCGSMANPVTSTDDAKGEQGNIMYVRIYASKSARESNFVANYTAFRTLDPNKHESCDLSTEFDCEDNTCVDNTLRCDGYGDCRLKADEDATLCKGETQSLIHEPHIKVILVIFSLILSGMSFVFLFKCFRKLYQDHKIIKEHIRQSTEDRLDTITQLDSRFTLDAKKLQRDSEPRVSLERENHTNEMFKQQRKLSQQRKPSSIDSDFIQETHLDLEEEPWRREVDSVPIEAQDIKIERNGRMRRETSRREESIRSRKESEERKPKKEIRDASVGAPDTKESGCQTRESLFQTEAAPSSDGSGSNGRGFSTFGYSGATIARPSPPAPTNTSEITIELLKQVPPHQDSVKSQKKIPDRRPMSTETTRSAPDVIIVSKPIR